MGRLLSALPTDVHLGKFLLTAALFRCLDPALTIAATLNSKSPFLTPFGHEDEADRAKLSFRTGMCCSSTVYSSQLILINVENSDFLTLHNAFSSWRRASANPSFVRKFCRKNFLSHQVACPLLYLTYSDSLQTLEPTANRRASPTIPGLSDRFWVHPSRQSFREGT